MIPRAFIRWLQQTHPTIEFHLDPLSYEYEPTVWGEIHHNGYCTDIHIDQDQIYLSNNQRTNKDKRGTHPITTTYHIADPNFHFQQIIDTLKSWEIILDQWPGDQYVL